jgi:hypothetical protein
MASPKELSSLLNFQRALPTRTAAFKEIECDLRISNRAQGKHRLLHYAILRRIHPVRFVISASLQILVTRMPVNTRVPQGDVS